FDRVVGNALVGTAIKAKHGCLDLSHDVERRLVTGAERTSGDAVPRHAALQLRVVRGVHPHDAATPAEAGDPNLVRITAVFCCPGGGGIEVPHDLCVADLRNEFADQFRNV